MVNYVCYRCDYKTDHKSKMSYHLNRKITCKTIRDNVELENISESILEGKTFDEYIIKIKQIEMSQNVTKMSQNATKMSTNTIDITPNKLIFSCEYCNQEFRHIQSLNRHKKNRCKKYENNKNNENMIELVKLLNEQLKEQKEQMKEQNSQIKDQNNQIKELIKKAGITNIQQNIKLLSYGSTDISHLTDKDFLKCLNHSEGWACPARPVANFCIPHLIEKIHFNPKNPENHHRID